MFIKVDGKIYQEVAAEDFAKEAEVRLAQIEGEMQFHKTQAEENTAKWNALATERASLEKALKDFADAK